METAVIAQPVVNNVVSVAPSPMIKN